MTKKFVLANILLLCLLSMPYGYYMLVRFVAMMGFAIIAYEYMEKEEMPLAITFGGLALLFQPFVKVALGRVMWNVVDVLVAALLVGLLLRESNDMKNLKKKE